MKIYIDLVLFLNFAFDFILLLTVSVLLKRRTLLKRIFLGSIIGSLTILVLFIPFTTLKLFILKILLSILIIIVTFGFKNIFTNLFYFYLTSIILGGFMYYLNINMSYKNIGMIFYHKGISVNYIFILLLGPSILYIYTKQMKKYKLLNSNTYKIDVYIKNNIIKLTAFMDTGNKLLDPYKKRKVIIVKKDILKDYIKEENMLLVPYESVNTTGILECIKVDKVYIEKIGIRTDIVIGVTDDFSINGYDCILNYLLIDK